jgi:unsaturated rhamnogalacturonyl hydrolase
LSIHFYKLLKTIFSNIYIALLIVIANPSISYCQKNSDEMTVTLKIAELVLEKTNFEFLEKKSTHIYKSVNDVSPDAKLSIASPYNDWRYWNGLVNLAMLELSKTTNDTRFAEYAKQNISFVFDNYQHFKNQYQNENKWNYPFGQFFILEELDDCGAMGASVIEVYKKYPQKRFKKYIDKAAEHIVTRQQRLKDGTLVRSFPEKWTIWADDLYMSISFLARYGELTENNIYFDDAAKQVINFHKYLFDENKGLMHHAWYSDIKKPSVAYWGRANGWAMLAQIDLLERLPINHPQRDTLIDIFHNHALGIAKYQSANGLWNQLLDKEDSYLETSCSAMFTYAIARAVNLGILESRYGSIATAGWEGLVTKILPDGQIEGVCTGTIVYDNLKSYYERPTPLNDIHGIGVVILAGTEFSKLQNQK